eukprot:GSChrysophyteH1.ASY1.ANO1.2235.1 assembled CDS
MASTRSLDTLLDRLSKWAQIYPHKSAWSFLNDSGKSVEDSYTYAELERCTSALAAHLLSECNIKARDRVLLVFFPGLDFTVSLIACFKAGIIAVPVFPPDPRKLKKDLHHFVSIQNSSGAKICLTHASYNFAKNMAGAKNIFSLSGKKSTSASMNMNISATGVKDSDIAFLQYTSGSTSEPKGVMISHSNLSHNLNIIMNELRCDDHTIEVSWLPQYHDMGLIGSYLGCVFCGGSGYYISPLAFLKDPTTWVKAMGTFAASHTQAPNFAYALTVRKWKAYVKQCEQSGKAVEKLDLSRVQHMINAAEPVDASAIQDFYELFQSIGLSPKVVVPTYGLAEHCVFVCSGGKLMITVSKDELANDLETSDSSRSDETLQTIVGCGYPGKSQGVDVRIVIPGNTYGDISTNVGEIWVNSPSKAQGYWEQEDITASEFQAVIKGTDGQTQYLRTGDMGFYYKGELFICGRIKDLIIIRGSNHYPQDLEKSAESSCDLLRLGCNGTKKAHTETLTYAKKCDMNTLYAEITENIRQAIAKDHGLAINTIVLLHDRSIPKTTSGKITRKGTQKALASNKLSILHRWDAVTADDVAQKVSVAYRSGTAMASSLSPTLKFSSKEELMTLPFLQIQDALEDLLVTVTDGSPAPQEKPIDPSDSLLDLGLDSMTIAQFKGALDAAYYTACIPDDFMFTNLATLEGLSLAVKRGGLTPEQAQKFEEALAGIQGEDDDGIATIQRQPFCPWYTCCY